MLLCLHSASFFSVVLLTTTLNTLGSLINPNMNKSGGTYSKAYSQEMTISRRLREAMNRVGIDSQSELARRSGVPQPTINRILNRGGRQGPATETLKKLAAACTVSFQWLADGADIALHTVSGEERAVAVPEAENDNPPVIAKPNRVDVAVGLVKIRKVHLHVSAEAAETAVFREEEIGDTVYLEQDWLKRRGYDGQMLIALTMIGESMEPGLYAQDTLIVNLADTKPLDGEVFVFNYEGTVLIRRLVRDAGKWWLSSDSVEQRRFRRKQYSIGECKIIGRVVYKSGERF